MERPPHVSPGIFLESTLQDFIRKERSRGESLRGESLMVPSKGWETKQKAIILEVIRKSGNSDSASI